VTDTAIANTPDGEDRFQQQQMLCFEVFDFQFFNPNSLSKTFIMLTQ